MAYAVVGMTASGPKWVGWEFESPLLCEDVKTIDALT